MMAAPDPILGQCRNVDVKWISGHLVVQVSGYIPNSGVQPIIEAVPESGPGHFRLLFFHPVGYWPDAPVAYSRMDAFSSQVTPAVVRLQTASGIQEVTVRRLTSGGDIMDERTVFSGYSEELDFNEALLSASSQCMESARRKSRTASGVRVVESGLLANDSGKPAKLFVSVVELP